VEFKYDGGSLGKGAFLPLLIDGENMSQGRTGCSIPHLISLDKTLDIGTDAAAPATNDDPPCGSEFNGVIKWVQIDLEMDDYRHMIDTDHWSTCF